MHTRPYKQVDVFTGVPYLGNPLAVVLDGSGLSQAEMQAFARWTNLSETTFVLPPSDAQADYQVRIFTPGGELPFAGHPTLGSCHAWLQAGGTCKSKEFVVQQCGVGLVRIRREQGRLAFGAPPLRRVVPDAALLAGVTDGLGLKAAQVVAAQSLDNGTEWLGLLLDDTATVLRLAPNFPALKDLGHKVGVAAVYALPASNADAPTIEVRGFAPHLGVNEDPVTGSLNASLAQWLMADGHVGTRYVAAQGDRLQRAGRVYLERDATGQVWVGGQSVTCIDGTVTL